MTNSEIMLMDAEYWGGHISAGEMMIAGDMKIVATVTHLANEYGAINRADFFYWSDDNSLEKYYDARSWFSLLISEAEKTKREQMDIAWPFPACFGNPV